MANKIIQMFLRGITLILMVLGFYYNSESKYLTRIDNFIILGICASYSTITLGLLMEAGLQLSSDKVVETTFLTGGITLALLGAILSFTKVWTSSCVSATDTRDDVVNNGVVLLLTVIIYILDLICLLY